MTKILLAVSVVGIAAGGAVDITQMTVNPYWTMVLPVGVVAFGLFLVVWMMEREMKKDTAQFDPGAAARKNVPQPSSQPKKGSLSRALPARESDFQSAENDF